MPSSPLWAVIGGSATVAVSNNEACVTATAAGTINFAWPQPSGTAGAVLSSSNMYTFSYNVRTTSGTATIDAKVGQTVSPYNADVESTTDAATTTSKPYTHPFSNKSDASAGIAFQFTVTSGQTVCFSAVSLVQN